MYIPGTVQDFLHLLKLKYKMRKHHRMGVGHLTGHIRGKKEKGKVTKCH